MKKYKITVFTPTYNRAYIIENLYKSLKKQTFKDFEWIVIDDGSTDRTPELIEEMINKDNFFDITYIRKDNGGQHTALNMGIPKAKGELFMIVDSDDYLSPDALEWITYYENTIEDKVNFAGVSGLRIYHNGKVIGGSGDLKKDYIDATGFERKKYNLLGDKAEAYYTKVLKKYYPIPEFKGENDVEKGVLWNRIANAGLKIRWFNKGIYYCEYLEDGMTRNIEQNYIKNFKGYTLWIKEMLTYDIKLLSKIKYILYYFYICNKKNIGYKEGAKNLDINKTFAFFADKFIKYKLFDIYIKIKNEK